MTRRRLYLTMHDVLGIIVIIYMQINVQAGRYKYLWSTEGSFSSPNYPGPYPSYLCHTWFMPYTSKELQLEFVELDLYKCFVQERYRVCNDFDYVYIKGKSYCNWNRPSKPIIFLPWTQHSVVFTSTYSSWDCKGRGFKVKYRPVDQWNETSTLWPTTITMITTTPETSSEWSVKKSDQDCNVFDYVNIRFTDRFNNDYYCNWNKPTKPITFLPWTRATIIFYSSYLSSDCKGRGFKVKYRPVDQWNETSTLWPTTITMITTTPETSSEWSGTDSSNGNQSLKFPVTAKVLLAILLSISFMLVIVCLYVSCRRRRRRRRRSQPSNQDVLQTAINNWNYQTGIPITHTGGTDPVPNTYQDARFLTVDIPLLHRTGSSDGIAQTRQPTTAGTRYADQSQTNDNERPENVADDPPPSYDEVWESDDLNRSQSFEPPPSYEVVMRESSQSL